MTFSTFIYEVYLPKYLITTLGRGCICNLEVGVAFWPSACWEGQLLHAPPNEEGPRPARKRGVAEQVVAPGCTGRGGAHKGGMREDEAGCMQGRA